jgi:nicotinic acid mononucleotide adenylyltransferase
VEEMLREFQLLVASRSGELQPPAEFQHRIHPLTLRGGHDLVSSTDVRERIARGEPWEHLVPELIVDQVREIYS